MVLHKPMENINADGASAPAMTGGLVGDGSFHSGSKPFQKQKPPIEILCNNQGLPPDMRLVTIRGYIWKKLEDLILNYRVVPGR